MPGSFVGGNEVLQRSKDIVNIQRQCKFIHTVAISWDIACTVCHRKNVPNLDEKSMVIFSVNLIWILHASTYTLYKYIWKVIIFKSFESHFKALKITLYSNSVIFRYFAAPINVMFRWKDECLLFVFIGSPIWTIILASSWTRPMSGRSTQTFSSGCSGRLWQGGQI